MISTVASRGTVHAAILLGWTHFKQILALFFGTLAASIHPWDRREFFRQMHVIGNQSLPLIFGAVSFIGMIMVAQAGMQIQRFVGNLALVGPIVMPLFIREFAPTIAGLMLATRIGAGIAAEIGSMKATEQLDALRMCNTDPITYLIVPRFWASIIMTLALSQFAVFVAMGAGATIAFTSFHVNPRAFVNLVNVHSSDVIVCLMKSCAYGAAIPIAASYCGMQASGGAEGVGTATTSAVVASSTAVIALDLIISLATIGW